MNALEKYRAGFRALMEKYQSAHPDEFRKQHDALNQTFKYDLEVEFGLVGHEKADQIFEMASYHSDEMDDLYCLYEDLAKLVK